MLPLIIILFAHDVSAADCPSWCSGNNCGPAHDLNCCMEAPGSCAPCSVCTTAAEPAPAGPCADWCAARCQYEQCTHPQCVHCLQPTVAAAAQTWAAPLVSAAVLSASDGVHHTKVSIVGDEWHINGEPTFKGRKWQGASMQGLMPNSRMVNAIFDDEHTATQSLWKYPDTQQWDPERHTNEFIEALPDYRAHGLLGVTVSLQGGSVCGNDPKDKSHPQCSSRSYDKVVSAFTREGAMKDAWFARLERVLTAADKLGMVVFLQMFYPKQAGRFTTNGAVVDAAESCTDWLLAKGFTNFVLDVCNECDWDENQAFMGHLGALFWPWHGGLLDRIRRRSKAGGREFIISSSFIGGSVPSDDKFSHLDFVNLHANNLWQWEHGSLASFVDAVRRQDGYRKMPSEPPPHPSPRALPSSSPKRSRSGGQAPAC